MTLTVPTGDTGADQAALAAPAVPGNRPGQVLAAPAVPGNRPGQVLAAPPVRGNRPGQMLTAPAVPGNRPGQVLAAPAPAASASAAPEEGSFSADWLPDFSARWFWTAGGVLAAVAGLIGFSWTRRRRP
ncbi:hypothetical protein [Actinoplanes sp. NPDC026623]|uniref:hypothetical protein n=1 Tax=Actinoplanes sp. NPDC026623 TaxID=3155610 RepID=UPI0033F49F10